MYSITQLGQLAVVLELRHVHDSIVRRFRRKASVELLSYRPCGGAALARTPPVTHVGHLGPRVRYADAPALQPGLGPLPVERRLLEPEVHLGRLEDTHVRHLLQQLRAYQIVHRLQQVTVYLERVRVRTHTGEEVTADNVIEILRQNGG